MQLTTPDLYKEASEKQGVDQGYLSCSAEVTNQGQSMSATQVTVTNTQVAVRYWWNVSSLSIDMSADCLQHCKNSCSYKLQKTSLKTMEVQGMQLITFEWYFRPVTVAKG